jgi:hypothetical protein
MRWIPGGGHKLVVGGFYLEDRWQFSDLATFRPVGSGHGLDGRFYLPLVGDRGVILKSRSWRFDRGPRPPHLETPFFLDILLVCTYA